MTTFQMRQEVMDACVALRSLCEAVRTQRRRASLSLSSIASSSNGTSVSSNSSQEETSMPRMDGKQEVTSLSFPYI